MSFTPNSGSQCFRRAILVSAGNGKAQANLEDDFHEFSVTLRYSEGRISAINGYARRYPWATCPGATRSLRLLVGMTLSEAPDSVYRHLDGRWQCTHLFEAAACAIAQAARGDGARFYEMRVADPEHGVRLAQLFQDQDLVLSWAIHDEMVHSSDQFDGMTFTAIGKWAAETGGSNLAEPALMLRRAARLSRGRQIDVESFPNAASMNMSGICHSFQPSIAPSGTRMKDSVRDFNASGAAPLGSLIRGRRN